MSESENKITLQEICYYIFFSALFFSKGIGLYDGQMAFKIFLVISIAFFAAKMLLTEYDLYEAGIIGLLGICSFLSYWHTGEKGILLVFMMVSGLKNISLKQLWKVALMVWCLSYLPAVVLTTLKIVDSPFKVHIRPMVGFAIRWGMGSSHPNVGHVGYLVLAVLVVYVLGEKISWKWCLLLFAGNCYVFLYTISQTGFLMTSFYLAAVIYLMCRKNPSRLEYGIVQCVLPLCVLISIVLPVVLEGKAFDILNKLTNTRMVQSRRYLMEEEITWFGRALGLNNAGYTLDNSFMFAFMTYGIVTFLILMLAYYFIIRKYIREERKRELAVIVTMLVAGISEPFLFNTSFKNLSLLFLGELIFEGNRERKGILSKKICLGGGWNREFVCGKARKGAIGRIEDEICLFAGRLKKGLFAGALAGGLLWSVSYAVMVKPPEEILVPYEICDYVDKPELLYLTPEDLDDKAVLGYVNEDTPMLAFGGTLVQIEYVREIVCRFVYGACIGMGIILTVGYIRRKGSEDRCEDFDDKQVSAS